jgi:hypothetical protein
MSAPERMSLSVSPERIIFVRIFVLTIMLASEWKPALSIASGLRAPPSSALRHGRVFRPGYRLRHISGVQVWRPRSLHLGRRFSLLGG